MKKIYFCMAIFTSLLTAASLPARMTGEGEEDAFKELKNNPAAAIKLALRSKSRSISTCAFGLYLQSPASAKDTDLVDNILKMAEQEDLFFHTATITAASFAYAKSASSPLRRIVDGLVEQGPEGQAFAAAVLCALALADDEQSRIAEELSVFDLGIAKPAKKGRKAGAGSKKRKSATGPQGLPIPDVLFTKTKARSPAQATTAQMAILAAALWNDKTVAEHVEAVPLKQRGIPGAKLLYAARTGGTITPELVQLAFSVKPDPANLIAEVSPALSQYNPILPDAAMACRALGVLKNPKHLPLLHKALTHPDLRVQVDAARALDEIGAAESMGPLSRHLMTCAWPVLVPIAEALGHHPDKRVIPALIKRLGKEKGRFRLDLLHALNSIAGEKKYDKVEEWLKWYRKEAAAFEVNPAASATYRQTYRLQDLGADAYTYFYGIHIYSDRFVYVIDSSASMRGDRIYSLRHNLSQSIERIKDGALFNLVDFGGDVVTFESGKLVDDKRKAIKRVEKMPLTLGTRSFDAIEQAAALPGVDTLIFLSDGAPARSKIRSWLLIRRTLGLMRRYRPLVISCIDFDPSAGNQASMQWLAAENYGQHESINVEAAPE